MSKKQMNEQDLEDWKTFRQTVRPIKREGVFSVSPVKKKLSLNPFSYYREEIKTLPLVTKDFSVQKKSTRRLKKIAIEAQIDLHGLTKIQAQEKLQSFLLHAQMQRKIWVLIITGKGWGEETLKTLVPQWLSALPYVCEYDFSKPQHGGQGALYVRLKKLSFFF